MSDSKLPPQVKDWRLPPPTPDQIEYMKEILESGKPPPPDTIIIGPRRKPSELEANQFRSAVFSRDYNRLRQLMFDVYPNLNWDSVIEDLPSQHRDWAKSAIRAVTFPEREDD